MQRRLTDDEQKQIQEVCGELENLDVYVSGRLELTEKLLAMAGNESQWDRLKKAVQKVAKNPKTRAAF